MFGGPQETKQLNKQLSSYRFNMQCAGTPHGLCCHADVVTWLCHQNLVVMRNIDDESGKQVVALSTKDSCAWLKGRMNQPQPEPGGTKGGVEIKAESHP